MALLIGYGNDLRGDDAAGRVVAQRVRDTAAVAVEVHEAHQLTPELADVVARADRAVFVDAYVAQEGDAAQAVHIPEYPTDSPLGHIASPSSLLALADCLYGRRPEAWLVTVPAVCFDYGSALSQTTRRGIADAVDLALALLADTRTPDQEDTAACTK